MSALNAHAAASALHDVTPSCVTMRDGRQLAYCDAGDPVGAPVLFLHGSPGSRLFVPPNLPKGIRLITFDRSGYGGSDPCIGRTLIDVADDAIQLLDFLKIDLAAVVAWSGGCPFGAALAAAHPDRVPHLALVSGPGPLDDVPGAFDRLGDRRLASVVAARRGEHERARRGVVRAAAPMLADPVAFLGSGRGPDRPILTDPALRPMLESQMVAAWHSSDGIADDLMAMWLPFGFALCEITVSTHVFQGALDRDNVVDAHTYAEQIPGATLTIWPDLGHFGVLVRFEEIIASIT